MTIDEVIQVLNIHLSQPLTSLQEFILRRSWDGKTYNVIAQEAYYGPERIRKISAELWSVMSHILREPISKANFRKILEPRPLSFFEQQLTQSISQSFQPLHHSFPGSPLPPQSDFYVRRPPIEELAYAGILEPGNIIRIRAPRKMGKSSLALRIIERARTENYRVASVDFQQAEAAVFANLDRFLRWFCANITQELELSLNLNEYWDEEIGSKVSCTIYFQNYLLKLIQSPMVLVLNELNRVFEYPEVAQEFLPLLRFWHEQARKSKTWQQLRVVVTYSTEIHIPLKLHQSPFNVGLPLVLPPFNTKQVKTLAQRYLLNWIEDADIERLMSMVGGHPYLIQLALHHLAESTIDSSNPAHQDNLDPTVALNHLLTQAPTEAGIYSNHLRGLLVMLQENTKLKAAAEQVTNHPEGVKLEPVIAYKLDSLGLITLNGDVSTYCCELYRLYFSKQFPTETTPVLQPLVMTPNDELATVDQEQLELQRICYLDELTQLPNRRYFNKYLQRELKRSVRDHGNLSLILCDIDFFKIYNVIYGYPAGDECLQQIAQTLQNCVKRPEDLVARFGGEEFSIILPRTDLTGAVCVAERIREGVKALEMKIESSKFGGFPEEVVTVSLGVANMIPHSEADSQLIIQAADQALYQSKKKGRNRVSSSSPVEISSSPVTQSNFANG
ncbi:MAG: AAA-like domain-containing protein [Microcoleaceae cyanobacterium]